MRQRYSYEFSIFYTNNNEFVIKQQTAGNDEKQQNPPTYDKKTERAL